MLKVIVVYYSTMGKSPSVTTIWVGIFVGQLFPTTQIRKNLQEIQKKSLSCPVGRRKSEALAQPNAIWPHAKGPLWTLVTVVLILTPVTGVSWTDLPMRVGMGFWCLHRDVEYRPY